MPSDPQKVKEVKAIITAALLENNRVFGALQDIDRMISAAGKNPVPAVVIMINSADNAHQNITINNGLEDGTA